MKKNNYKKYLFLLSILYTCFINAGVFEGYTLFTPLEISVENSTTYLINNDQEIINTWTHEFGPASMPYLRPDSSIIYPYRVANPTMVAGGVGGGIQKQSWDGEILWEYTFSDETYQHHHDVEPLPSGNILIIVWEKKTAQEAYDLGRESITNPLNQVWSNAILELNPETGEIEWEWHIWDHLVQDVYPDLDNYGVISDHPELFDINCGDIGIDSGGPQGANADWMHVNSINYNPHLDQIAISSRSQNEIYIIDHSTTTEEAASHSGGNSGKGGDILYRWGNPQNYDRGTSDDKILGWQHGINWIDPEFPGGGNIMIFNNNHYPGSDSSSTVIEIKPPMDENGNYIIIDELPYGPIELDWIYNGDFETPVQGGAFRLPNGNTIVCQTHTSKLIEVTLEGEIVWEFQYVAGIGSSWIARAQKYSPEYLMNNMLGDMNEDGIFNVLDIVILANLILTNDNTNMTGDMNQDNILNVLDIVILANMILS